MIWQSALGIVAIIVTAWILSEDRSRPPYRIAAAGVAIHIAVAAILLKTGLFAEFFLGLNSAVTAIQDATRAGTSFVFGYVGGGPLPFTETYPGASFIFAFQALPLILVVSALSALLFHWRVLPLVVRGFAWALDKTMGVGGAAGMAVAANVFVGMVEAPLLIRPYMAKLTRGELFMVMTAGMATIAGTMMILYATVLVSVVPDAMGHILTASLINAPAAITIAKLMVPGIDVGEGSQAGENVNLSTEASGAMDAITQGTTRGVQLLINVVAMLVVLVALVSLANIVLGLLPEVAGGALTLERLLGWAMVPLVWLMGVPWEQAQTAGGLMGIKVILNEFLAYIELAKLPADALDDRSRLIMTYALCGFANFGSLGIMIGGLATMAPERRSEIVELGPKSIVAGVLATSLSGAVIGLLV
jgi:CNT family concentrative nucleoside transporter